MSDINKKVRIDADASSLASEMERISSVGNDLYSGLKKDAAEYSDDLQKQSIYIEKNLNLEEKRLKQAIELNKIRMKQKMDEEIQKNPTKEQVIRDKYSDLEKYTTKDYLSVKAEILEARSLHSEDFDEQQRKKLTVVESNMDSSKTLAAANDAVSTATDYSSLRRAAGYGATMGRTLSAGLGLGLAFGIGGILSSMIENSVALDKASKNLNVTIGGLSDTMFDSSYMIGKTKTEMMELTKEIAVVSGGKYGTRSADVSTSFATFSKGFGVDLNQLVATLSTQRITKSDIPSELMNFFREMLKSGAIKQGDMAQLTEKIDYWARLNDMQAKQMLVASPFRSTALLGAMQETNLPVMSDQRQLDLLEGINEAIKNPGSDYKNAFVMNALNRNQGLVDTLIRKEQGIFGEGNIKSIFDNLKQNFGKGNQDNMILIVQDLFKTSYQTSQMLVKSIFNNDKAYEKFIKAVDENRKFSKQYENETDPEKRKKILSDWNKLNLGMKDAQGNDIVDPNLASANATSRAEQIKNMLIEVSGNAGKKIFSELDKMNPQEMEKYLNTFAGALSTAAAEAIKIGAEMIKDAGPIFRDAANVLKPALEKIGYFYEFTQTIPKGLAKSYNQIFHDGEGSDIPGYKEDRIIKDNKGRAATGWTKDEMIKLQDELWNTGLGKKYSMSLIEGYDPTGKGHNPNSLHYKNQAIDVSLYDKEKNKIITKDNYPEEIKKFLLTFASKEGIKSGVDFNDNNHLQVLKTQQENTAALKENNEIHKNKNSELKRMNDGLSTRIRSSEGARALIVNYAN